MAKKLSNRGYNREQEWHVFNRLRKTVDNVNADAQAGWNLQLNEDTVYQTIHPEDTLILTGDRVVITENVPDLSYNFDLDLYLNNDEWFYGLKVAGTELNLFKIDTSDHFILGTDLYIPNENKLIFGDSDLKVYHDGTNGYIENLTGDLYVFQDATIPLHIDSTYLDIDREVNLKDFILNFGYGPSNISSYISQVDTEWIFWNNIDNALTSFHQNGLPALIIGSTYVHVRDRFLALNKNKELRWVNNNELALYHSYINHDGNNWIFENITGDIIFTNDTSKFMLSDEIEATASFRNYTIDIYDDKKIRWIHSDEEVLSIYHDGEDGFIDTLKGVFIVNQNASIGLELGDEYLQVHDRNLALNQGWSIAWYWNDTLSDKFAYITYDTDIWWFVNEAKETRFVHENSWVMFSTMNVGKVELHNYGLDIYNYKRLTWKKGDGTEDLLLIYHDGFCGYMVNEEDCFQFMAGSVNAFNVDAEGKFFLQVDNPQITPASKIVTQDSDGEIKYRTIEDFYSDFLPIGVEGQTLYYDGDTSSWVANSGLFYDDTNTAVLVGYIVNPGTYKLAVNGTGYFADALTLATISHATADTGYFLVSDGGVIKYRTTTEIYGALLNDQWFTSYDSCGAVYNVFKVSKNNVIEFGGPIEIGALYTVPDAGDVSIANMAVIQSVNGQSLSYSMTIGDDYIWKSGGLADGAGGLTDRYFYVNGELLVDYTTNPVDYKLAVNGSGYFNSTLTINSISDAGSDVDKFLTSSSGVVTYRTGTEVLADLDLVVGVNLLPSGTEGQMLYNNAGTWTVCGGLLWEDANYAILIGYSTNPGTYRFAVNGDGLFSGSLTISTIAHAATDPGYVLVSEGGVIKYRLSSEIYSALLNDEWFTSFDTTGEVANVFKVSTDNTIRFGMPVEIGALYTVPDAGNVAIANMPVISSVYGTLMQYSIGIDYNTGLKIGAYSDGAGSIYNDFVSVTGDLTVSGFTTIGGILTISTIDNLTTPTTKILVSDSGIVKYRTAAEILSDINITHALLSATHTDTLVDSVIAGDILIGNATPKWSRLAKASQYTFLTMGASLPGWSDFYLTGTTGGKTTFAVTSSKTLTLTSTDDYNLTIPKTGTAVVGTGTATRIAEWVTDVNTLQASTLIKTGTNTLTLATGAAAATVWTIPINAAGYLLNDGSGTMSWVSTLLSNALTDTYIFVGNGSNIATGVPVSGEVSVLNTGAFTLSNSAVIGKVLTGYVAGSGSISSSDTILSAIEKLSATIGLFQLSDSDTIDALYPVRIGALYTEPDAGLVAMANMPVMDSLYGSEMSYSIGIDYGCQFKVVAYSDGAGGIYNEYIVIDAYVGINTNAPTEYLDINGNARIRTENVLKFYDADDSHYTGLKAGTTTTSSVTYSLPTADGTNGYVLATNGSGTLSWVANGAGVETGITSLNGLTAAIQTFSATSPITISSATATHTIGITQASTSTSGYLSDTDWNVFNNKANASLNNLSSVAINAALVLGTSDQYALGSASKLWADLYLADGAVIYFTNDYTITHSTGYLTFSKGASFIDDKYLTFGSSGASDSYIYWNFDGSEGNQTLHIRSNNYHYFETIAGTSLFNTSSTGVNIPTTKTYQVAGNEIFFASGSALTYGSILYKGTGLKTAGCFNGSTTAPTDTTRLNYEGYFYATRFNGLTLTVAATGFTIAGGTTSKTLTVDTDYTISNAVNKTIFDALGDLVVGSGDNAYKKLILGSPGQVLKVNSGGTDIEWGAASSGTVSSVTASLPLSSSGGTTPNITIAQGTGAANGYILAADWTTFNNKVGGSGTQYYIPRFATTSTLGDSIIWQHASSSYVNIGTTGQNYTLYINGTTKSAGVIYAVTDVDITGQLYVGAATDITFNSATTRPRSISIASRSDADGKNLLVMAQSSTKATSTGGALYLGGGNGTSVGGPSCIFGGLSSTNVVGDVYLNANPNGYEGKVYMGFHSYFARNLDTYNYLDLVLGEWETGFRVYMNTTQVANIGLNYATFKGLVRSEGDVEAAYNTSDARLKTDLDPITDGMSVINRLKPTWYTSLYPYYLGQRHAGLIAQEVQKEIGCAVWERSDGYLGLRDERITPFMISAIQNNYSEIEGLKSKIKDQDEVINELRLEIDRLQHV